MIGVYVKTTEMKPWLWDQCCSHWLSEFTRRPWARPESRCVTHCHISILCPWCLPSPDTLRMPFLAYMPAPGTPVETVSPAIRLIDGEVKPPSVQCRELMGFCSPGQIPRILLVPEHFACGVYDKKVQM